MDRGGSQKKRNNKAVANVDIISNLPDVIKDKILCCLPMKEALGTCVLSRKWRYTWASMTELTFREDDFDLGNGIEEGVTKNFINFINMVLSLHNGPILKFELNARRVHLLSPGGHIQRWMLMLSRNGVKEIQIRTKIWRNYKIPSSFFSCEELEYAFLQGELVARCPNLEKLILSRLLSFADISILSTRLKILRVDGMFKHLSLVTPHVSSAVINLQVNTGYVPRAGCNFNLSQFIGSLLDIENISLLGHAFECAAHGILPGKLPRLLNRLTEITLEIDLGNLKEANAAHCLFQVAPNLRRVELQLIYRGYATPTSVFWDSIDHQAGLFNNLDTVVLNNFAGSCAESGFLRLLLEDAPMLRIAQIKDNNKLDKESLKHLLKMKRASKDAEVILL
ncbi:F-box/FBD/LRR-repeat protein At1g13570-like isoform X2 [Panicum virgatum]|uniref:F-box/FBD/LRR-repeat protein At1g13570-like isoform X2 n=1 Tax=Panicum virgatum TaxID=38727 RepID=UPI0019D55293|nr:F-box/FBD/LRR-repeat protein At1g13570-like isoform X2 [Panicum virgatum]